MWQISFSTWKLRGTLERVYALQSNTLRSEPLAGQMAIFQLDSLHPEASPASKFPSWLRATQCFQNNLSNCTGSHQWGAWCSNLHCFAFLRTMHCYDIKVHINCLFIVWLLDCKLLEYQFCNQLYLKCPENYLPIQLVCPWEKGVGYMYEQIDNNLEASYLVRKSVSGSSGLGRVPSRFCLGVQNKPLPLFEVIMENLFTNTKTRKLGSDEVKAVKSTLYCSVCVV